MAVIFDGKQSAENRLRLLAQEIVDNALKPHLVIILVGEDSASKIYVDAKVLAGTEIGAVVEVLDFPEHVAENEVIRQIKNLNKDKSVHGIIVQLPLPRWINKEKVLMSIDPQKDVDGLTSRSNFVSATALAVEEILKESRTKLKGSYALVIGDSDLVGKPVAIALLKAGATVTICNEFTSDISQFTKEADVLVSAVGKPNLITADLVKKGVVVVDVGISKVEDKVVGDVDFDQVKHTASFITPVPGGVGPMTVAMLLSNLIEASKL